MNFDLHSLGLELAVLGLFGIVFTADLLLGRDEKRGLGSLTSMGLALILVGSYFFEYDGTALFDTYVSDGPGLFFKRVLLLAGALGALGSIDHADNRLSGRQGEHYMMLLASLIGMLLLTGARDLLLWVVSFELAGIPLIVMVAMHKGKASVESSLKLYLSGAASSVLLLYGVSFMWGLAGGTEFSALAAATESPLFNLGIILLIAGVSFKLGLAPFHLWVADAYQGAPTPTVAFISVAPKIAVIAALARLLSEGLASFSSVWLIPLLVLSVITMVVGNLTAVTQNDSRRMLALSGVGHMGLLILALVVGGVDGYSTLMFYALAYVVTNMGAFLVVSAVNDARGNAELSNFNGLARTSPGLSLAMLGFLFSLGGIPFLIGFWAKLFVFRAAWLGGHEMIVVLGVFLAVLALFYYLRIARAIYIEKPDSEEGVKMGLPTSSAVVICALATAGLGLVPNWVMEVAVSVAAELPQIP